MKVNIVTDADRKELAEKYQWAVDRFDAIINETAWTNAKVIIAVVDEAKILKNLLRFIKNRLI